MSVAFVKKRPFSLFAAAGWLLRTGLRVRVVGREHLPDANQRVLIVANHVSTLDALLLSVVFPTRILFAAPGDSTKHWWSVPYWQRRFCLDQHNPRTAKTMVEALKAGLPCLIFPEGRLTRTGALMKVYESPGMIADKAGAAILPVRIEGLQYSPFSAVRGVRRRLLPQTTVTILPPRRLSLPDAVKGHRRRLMAGRALSDVMEEAAALGWSATTLMRQLLASKSVRGNGIVVEDAARRPLPHNVFVERVFTLARLLGSALNPAEKNVGVMLPNSVANAIAIFAIQAANRASAMLNFTSSPLRVVQACQMAQVKNVLTQRAFVTGGHLEATVEALTTAGIRVLYLEDAVPSFLDKAAGGLRARLPARLAAHGLADRPDDPSVILFTSGSEGAPKGVVLSHRNIAVNGLQYGVRVGFTAADVAFAQLPMFHSFGLTLGFFLPILTGARAFLFPSPLRYHDIPDLVYDTGATFMLGTDTFLANYGRYASTHDFYFLRIVTGGAERIKSETRQLWAEKFGVRLLEGYGTTETSPVISANGVLHYKADTVGRIVAGMQAYTKPVEGIAGGGELVVRGPNVMLGYLKIDRPGVIQAPEGGWYNTGDIAGIDEDGFVTIRGRTKRFAKVGGEMVSLGAIEAVVGTYWPDTRHVAVSVPQDRRGEAVVLLTESDDVDLHRLPALFRAAGLTELSLPRRLIKVPQIPLLGSGKTDYVGARAVALHTDAEAE